MTNREAIDTRTPADEAMAREEGMPDQQEPAWAPLQMTLREVVAALELRPRAVDALAWLLGQSEVCAHFSFGGVRKRWPGNHQKVAFHALHGRLSIRQTKEVLRREKVVWGEILDGLSADQQEVWRAAAAVDLTTPAGERIEGAGTILTWLLGADPAQIKKEQLPKVMQRVIVFTWQYARLPLWSHMSFANLGDVMGCSRYWATQVWAEVFQGTGVICRARRGGDVRAECAARQKGKASPNRRGGK